MSVVSSAIQKLSSDEIMLLDEKGNNTAIEAVVLGAIRLYIKELGGGQKTGKE